MPPLTTDDRKLRLRVWGQENDFDPRPNLWSLNRYLIAGKLDLGMLMDQSKICSEFYEDLS